MPTSKFGGVDSKYYEQEQEVPPGSVLSVILFSLAINDITCIHSDVTLCRRSRYSIVDL